MTYKELKLRAVSKLPESIRHTVSVTKYEYLEWYSNGNEIKESEWLYITHLLEQKLNKLEKINYTAKVWKLNPKSQIEGYKWNQQGLHDEIWWTLLHATAEQRLQAMNEIGFI